MVSKKVPCASPPGQLFLFEFNSQFHNSQSTQFIVSITLNPFSLLNLLNSISRLIVHSHCCCSNVGTLGYCINCLGLCHSSAQDPSAPSHSSRKKAQMAFGCVCDLPGLSFNCFSGCLYLNHCFPWHLFTPVSSQECHDPRFCLSEFYINVIFQCLLSLS